MGQCIPSKKILINPDAKQPYNNHMTSKQDIIRTMQATQANGLIAKRFFHVTAPQHVDSILERMKDGEVFFGFILLPNSKKQPVEALICTNQRLMIWNNEFADDDEVALGNIETVDIESGWFSANLKVNVRIDDQNKTLVFKCEKEIMAAFSASLHLAMSDAGLRAQVS